MIYSVILLALVIAIPYMSIAWISHYEGRGFGEAIPWWLCIFCFGEWVKERCSIKQ